MPTSYDIAQLNIALPLAPLESPQLAEFVAQLEPVNALADAAPGFRWRLQTEDGDATAIRGFGDNAVLVNMSTWASVEQLADFVFGAFHAEIMRRRREWFTRMREAYTVLWWVPLRHRLTVGEAEQRLARLRAGGPSRDAFTFARAFPPPGGTTAAPTDDRWRCGV